MCAHKLTCSIHPGDDENKTGARLPRSRSTGDLETKAAAPRRVLSATAGSGSHSRRAGKVVSDAKRRRPPSRICKHDGCEQYVVDQGLCVRHGVRSTLLFSRREAQRINFSIIRSITGREEVPDRRLHEPRQAPGQMLAPRYAHPKDRVVNLVLKRLTNRPGGSTECKVPNCANRAKSRGFCWSHGGGTKCKAASCEKIAISNGLCWAHGGGSVAVVDSRWLSRNSNDLTTASAVEYKLVRSWYFAGKRCIVKNCMRQAYERTNNLCNSHYQEWQHGVQDMEIDESDEMDESKPPPPPPPATSTPGFNTVHL